MSTLSFDISVSNKKFISSSLLPFQIMPANMKNLTEDMVTSYPIFKHSEKRKILIHTWYGIRPWKEDNRSLNYLLGVYVSLAKKLGTDYILIHGPGSLKEFEFFDKGLEWLNDFQKKYDVKICIEIVAFAKNVFENFDVNFDFIIEYVEKIIKNFDIIFDTAHLWSNGLDGKDMITLLEKYKKYYSFVHLNGNSSIKFKKDKHVGIIDKSNKITHMDELLKYLSSLDKICICEFIIEDEEYWKDVEKKYKFNICYELLKKL